MAIQKVNPNGWQKKSKLTASQINQLDQNAACGIDKRSGNVDVIESNLTMASGSSLNMIAGSSLYITPSTVTVYPGTLHVGAEIIGDDNNNDPLRFGIATIAITGTAYTLTSSEYNKGTIILQGYLTDDTILYLPVRTNQTDPINGTTAVSLEGWFKIIDNQTIPTQVLLPDGSFNDGYSLTLQGLDESGGDYGDPIILPAGVPSIVYCDGNSLIQGPYKSPHSINSIQHNYSDQPFPTSYQVVSGSTNVTPINGYTFTFYGVTAGDLFEISYTAGAVTTSNSYSMSIFVDVDGQLLYDTTWSVASTTEAMNTFFTTFAAQTTKTTDVRLCAQLQDGSNPGSVLSPLSFTVKHIKQ